MVGVPEVRGCWWCCAAGGGVGVVECCLMGMLDMVVSSSVSEWSVSKS